MKRRPDDERFVAFVREHGDSLLRFSRLLVADPAEAEDLLQVALLRLSRHWHREVDAPVAYTRRILVNLARDGFRRQHLVPLPADGSLTLARTADPGPDLAEAIAAQQRLDALLAALPARQRATVVLRVLDGLSEAETAELLACSPGTVKSNLARGLGKLRAALGPALASTEEGPA